MPNAISVLHEFGAIGFKAQLIQSDPYWCLCYLLTDPKIVKHTVKRTVYQGWYQRRERYVY